jgi:hypothetical protein
VAAGATQEDPDPAAPDAARGAAVLALHADRLLALLHEPGLVRHQHPPGTAEVLGDVRPLVVAGRVGVPPPPAEETSRIPSGVRPPAASASCQPFSRPAGAGSPRS